MRVNINIFPVIFLVFSLVALVSCDAHFSDPIPVNQNKKPAEVSSVADLQIFDHIVGDGNEARNSQRVAVHYTGWLYDENAADYKGEKFDSSHDRRRPFVFSLGNRDVIQGWEKGLLGMKVGGKRTLIIPPHMGYGSAGAGASIPPNATLVFDIELLKAG